MDYFWRQYLNSPEEAEGYADQLADAGVDVEKVRLPGLIHGAYNMSGAIPRWTEIHDATVRFLRDKLQAS